MRKFLIIPGRVASTTDAQVHMISAAQLMELYDVKREDCVIFPGYGYSDEYLTQLFKLKPLVSGNYTNGYKMLEDYNKEALQARIETAYSKTRIRLISKGIKIVEKKGWFWNTLGWLLKFVGNKEFNTGFITTLGPIIAVPVGWLERPKTAGKVATLVHEEVHTKQFKYAGLGSMWLGIGPMFLLYLLFPIPMGYALGRWWLERVAYVAGERAYRAIKGGKTTEKSIQWLAGQMIGGNYGYTMSWAPNQVKRYYEKHLLKGNK